MTGKQHKKGLGGRTVSADDSDLSDAERELIRRLERFARRERVRALRHVLRVGAVRRDDYYGIARVIDVRTRNGPTDASLPLWPEDYLMLLVMGLIEFDPDGYPCYIGRA